MIISDFLYSSSASVLLEEATMKAEILGAEYSRKLREFYKKMLDSEFLVRRKVYKSLKSFKSMQELLENLLENGFLDVEKNNSHGESLLFWLCRSFKDDNLAEIIELVCKYGADVNFCHPTNGFNPLMALINRCSRFTISCDTLMDVASILVNYGLDVNHTDAFGKDITHMILDSEDFSARSTIDFLKLLCGIPLE